MFSDSYHHPNNIRESISHLAILRAVATGLLLLLGNKTTELIEMVHTPSMNIVFLFKRNM